MDKVKCHSCDDASVIELQHGALCKDHFLRYFEEKVFKTISKYRLIDRKDKLCVAASGGKDSLTALYLTKKYCKKHNLPLEALFALVIDEGIENYRPKTIIDLQAFCKKQDIHVKKVSFKEEFQKTLDRANPILNKNSNKKPCNLCGVWRRFLLNKYARIYGANKIITGHNLDDEAQAIIMNLFKANTELASRLGPISGIGKNRLFVQRVKPLYFCLEKEVRLYALLKGFSISFVECPYSKEGYRHQIQKMLNEFENKYKGTKQGIVKSFLELWPKPEFACAEEIKSCLRCGEAASQDFCNACKMQEAIQDER